MQNNNIAQKFQEEFQKALESELFVGDLPKTSTWYTMTQKALNFASPLSLGISAKEFNDLVDIEPHQMNLYQFAILNNNLEKTSAHQLDIPMFAYCHMIKISNDLAGIWNKVTNAIRAEITARLILEQKEAEAKASKPAPFGKLKAEA